MSAAIKTIEAATNHLYKLSKQLITTVLCLLSVLFCLERTRLSYLILYRRKGPFTTINILGA
jgi:hypothetical protein